MTTTNIGKTIAKLLKINKMKRSDLAKKLDISDATLGRYIRSEREPSLATVAKIADIFDVSADYLLTGEIKERSGEPKDQRRFILTVSGACAIEEIPPKQF